MAHDTEKTLPSLKDGLDLGSVASLLGLPEAQLIAMTGIISRRTEADNAALGVRVREIVEVINRVEPWTGGKQQALIWFRGQGLPAFGDQTAEALLKRGMADAVRSYLDGM